MDLELSGERITEAAIDFAVVLRTDADSELRIGSPFAPHSATATHLVPVDEPADGDADRVAALVGQTITAAVVDRKGMLHLALSGGTRLDVESSDAYESWTFAGVDGRKVVAMPGGELAIWAADQDLTKP
ncbi:MAG TPA: DUF6188 family protein [Pseudonocardiaceae bacterium]|jgi:hypothetical protein